MKCYVPGCPNSGGISKEGISFHRIPSELKNEWLKAIGRHHVYKLMTNYRVCSQHFAAEDFYIIGDKKFLKKHSIPSLKVPRKEYIQFDFTKPLPMRTKKWADAAEREDKDLSSDELGKYRLCDENFENPNMNRKHLFSQAVPTIVTSLGYSSILEDHNYSKEIKTEEDDFSFNNNGNDEQSQLQQQIQNESKMEKIEDEVTKLGEPNIPRIYGIFHNCGEHENNDSKLYKRVQNPIDLVSNWSASPSRSPSESDLETSKLMKRLEDLENENTQLTQQLAECHRKYKLMQEDAFGNMTLEDFQELVKKFCPNDYLFNFIKQILLKVNEET